MGNKTSNLMPHLFHGWDKLTSCSCNDCIAEHVAKTLERFATLLNAVAEGARLEVTPTAGRLIPKVGVIVRASGSGVCEVVEKLADGWRDHEQHRDARRAGPELRRGSGELGIEREAIADRRGAAPSLASSKPRAHLRRAAPLAHETLCGLNADLAAVAAVGLEVFEQQCEIGRACPDCARLAVTAEAAGVAVWRQS